MTLYIPTTGATLLTGASDAEGDTITVHKINGAVIDWSTNPQTLALTVGTVQIWQDGTVRFDDAGLGAGRPAAGASVAAGSFTFTLWDGVAESPAYTANVGLAAPAAGDATDPAVTGMTPAAGATGVNSGALITVHLSEQCQFGPGSIEIWNATDATLIEAIATTAAGPGAGTVTMGSAQFTVQPTALLPGGKEIALRWVAGVVRDLAGRALPAATGSTFAFTTAVPVLTNDSPVSFTGSPVVGNTLAVVPGSWSGAATITLTYQWFRDGVAIAGATGVTYTLVTADNGTVVTVRETATASVNPPAPVSVMAVGVTVTAAANQKTQLEDECLANWAAWGWEGYTDTTGFTIYTETTPDAVKARWDAWRAGTPGTSKVLVYADWDGILNASATVWSGVASTKLTANAGAFAGYDQPATGGFWIKAAQGKKPKWGTTLKINGPVRLHVDGIAFCGQTNGGNGDLIIALNIVRTSTFPLTGQIAITNCNFGLYDNKPGLAWTEMTKGLVVADGRSLFLRGTRFAGCRDQIASTVKVRRMQLNDFEDNVSDVATGFSFDNGAIWSGHTVYDIDELNLVRNARQEPAAQKMHSDRSQHGATADVHAGYKTLRRWNLTHLKCAAAFDTAGQIFYQDDATTQRFDAVHYDSLECGSAYHHSVVFDQTGQGHHWIDRCTFLRAGDTYQQVDTFPQILVSSAVGSAPTTNGGTITIKDSVVERIANPAGRAMTVSGVKYVTPLKGKTSGDGSTQASAIRMENWIKGAVSRDGADFATYTIPGESSPDFATAWYALRDFYEPEGGYNTGSGSGCSDPATWPGAPARPAP